MVKIYDVNAIKQEIAELRQEAENLVKMAESEDRDLTDEENSRFEAIANDETGEIAALKAKLEKAEKFQAMQAESARALSPQPSEGGPGSDLVAPENRRRTVFATPRARMQVFRGENGPQEAYVFGQWLLCHHSKDPVVRQNAKNWLTDNGYQNAVTTTETVPTETAARLWEVREEVGAARRVCEVITMASEFMKVPKMTAGQTVYYPGKGVAITPSDPTFASVDLTAVTRGVLTQLANETQADSVVNMADRIASRAAHQLAYREDVEFVTGDGSAGFGSVTGLETAVTTNIITEGTPTAKVAYFGGFMAGAMIGSRDVLSIAQSEHAYFAENSIGIRATSRYDIQIHEEAAISALNVQAVANVTLDHLHQMVGAIASKYLALGGAFVMNRQFYHTIVQSLLYAQGGNTVAITEAGTQDQLFGFPVVMCDAVPASE